MTKRLKEICSHIPQCEAFADVGCDHGYCARYALERALAKRVYITDVSEKCLNKAKTLLKREIQEGRCIPLVGDGLTVLPEACTVLIAGMGGEEIVKILSYALPPVMLLQPMKNTRKLRSFLLENGCSILCDYTFEDGKFYDFIAAKRGGGDAYTERELLYGRDNLKNPSGAFVDQIRSELKKAEGYGKNRSLSQAAKEEIDIKINDLRELLHEIE